MKRLALPALAVALAVVALAQNQSAPTQAVPAHTAPSGQQEKLFDPKADPAKDLQNAIKSAKAHRLNILLDVGGDWCIWCRRLDAFFKSNVDAAKLLKENYVVVKVNFSQENENQAFLSKYPKISGYPHLFVLDSNGKLLHSQDTGLLETGDHHDPAKVMPFLKLWSPKRR